MAKSTARVFIVASLVGATMLTPSMSAHAVTAQCPDGGTKLEHSGTYNGYTITISGSTVTFSPTPSSISFCIKATTDASGLLDETALDSNGTYTVTWTTSTGQTPDVSYVSIYSIATPEVPTGTIGGLILAALVGVLLFSQVRRRKTAGQRVA
jgi:hypothetical protein